MKHLNYTIKDTVLENGFYILSIADDHSDLKFLLEVNESMEFNDSPTPGWNYKCRVYDKNGNLSMLDHHNKDIKNRVSMIIDDLFSV